MRGPFSSNPYLEVASKDAKDGGAVHLYPEEELLAQPRPRDVLTVRCGDPDHGKTHVSTPYVLAINF